MEYWRVYEKYTADPTLSDLTETQLVTTGEHQNVILDIIRQLREQKIRSVGGMKFKGVSVTAPVSASDELRRGRVEYCLDRTSLVIENFETGERRAAPGAPTFIEEVTLVEGRDGRWRVAEIRNREAPC